MCLTNEAAAIKLAERDNLVGELVEAVNGLLEAYENVLYSEFATPDCLDPASRDPKVIAARAVLAKADKGVKS